MLNKTPPDGHETKYLKDAAYEGDAEKSHRTNSFQSIDRIITESMLAESKCKPIFTDNRLFESSKSMIVEKEEDDPIPVEKSSIMLQSRIESCKDDTQQDFEDFINYL